MSYPFHVLKVYSNLNLQWKIPLGLPSPIHSVDPPDHKEQCTMPC